MGKESEINGGKFDENESSKIKKIKVSTSSLISASQVITTMWIAVKELIENSLDANSSSIVINAYQNGLERIEVIDNGNGIKCNDFNSISKKHHTSKLKNFESISSLETLGFRGEALHSLSILSESLHIITCTSNNTIGHKLEFSNTGNVKIITSCSRPRGTTVIINGLFSRCPVRCHHLKDQLNLEFSQTIKVIQQYAVLNYKVKFNLNNSFLKRSMSCNFKTLGKFTMKENFCAIFGNKILKSLIDFNKKEEHCKFEGFISIVSSSFTSRYSNDRCFINVNNRPCDINSISKTAKNSYQLLTSTKRFPFFVLLLQVPPSRIDINVTPDKRSIILIDEKQINESLAVVLNDLFSTHTRTLKFMQVKVNKEIKCPSKRHLFENKNEYENILKRQKIYESFNARDSALRVDNSLTNISENCSSEKNNYSTRPKLTIINDSRNNSNQIEESDDLVVDYKDTIHTKLPTMTNNLKIAPGSIIIDQLHSISNICQETNIEPFSLNNNEFAKISITKLMPNKEHQIVEMNATQCSSKDLSATSDQLNQIMKPKYMNKKRIVTLNFNFNKMKNKYQKFKDENKKITINENNFIKKREFRAKISANENIEAESELTKVISKDMFKQMKICGQFNLGFIIAKHGNNIFVIDQHASDEKFNYEDLKRNTEIRSQNLVISQKLTLTFRSEEILINNLEIFHKNGFKFKINHQAETGRICLTALPFSKNWIFGPDDIEEMIFILSESPGMMCRPSRIDKMFASRACRKSIMIGTALTTLQMKKIVNHMSEMEAPWNCPHGRPTMRHLFNLKQVNFD